MGGSCRRLRHETIISPDPSDMGDIINLCQPVSYHGIDVTILPYNHIPSTLSS